MVQRADAFGLSIEQGLTKLVKKRDVPLLLAFMVLSLYRVDEDAVSGEIDVLPLQADDFGRDADAAVSREQQQQHPVLIAAGGGDQLIDPVGLDEVQTLRIPLVTSLHADERILWDHLFIDGDLEELASHDDATADCRLCQRPGVVCRTRRLKKLLEADGVRTADGGQQPVRAEVVEEVAEDVTVGRHRALLHGRGVLHRLDEIAETHVSVPPLL